MELKFQTLIILVHKEVQGASGACEYIFYKRRYSSKHPHLVQNMIMLYRVCYRLFKKKQTRKISGNFRIGSSEAGITLDGPINKDTSFIFSLKEKLFAILFLKHLVFHFF